MIISRTPYRISFIGGGTDYPAWYRTHGGAVLGATIDKYCYLNCRYLPPFFNHRFRVVYSQMEQCNSLEEIQHPAVREILRYLRFDRGAEIHHVGDLPARSGMGTSSSFTVGLLHAVYALRGLMPSKAQLATDAIHVEQDVLAETVGSQDQILTSYGGVNHVVFSTNGEYTVRPLIVSAERMWELSSHLLLFFTGMSRTASTVANTYVGRVEKNADQLRQMVTLVDDGIAILTSRRSIVDFGELLHEGWLLKQSLSSQISNDYVGEIYQQARAAGAIGGKLLGAGGGGFMLFLVPPDRQVAVKERLKNLVHVPFRFEFSGSQIIHLDVERDYLMEEQAQAIRAAGVYHEAPRDSDKP